MASSERSFSKLKLIKNHLRSTMGQLRLSNLAILSIKQEIKNGIDFGRTISEFAQMEAKSHAAIKISLWSRCIHWIFC